MGSKPIAALILPAHDASIARAVAARASLMHHQSTKINATADAYCPPHGPAMYKKSHSPSSYRVPCAPAPLPSPHETYSRVTRGLTALRLRRGALT
ncbi:hypothetical protein BD626DRAFT_498198 [Schizophyllum amplum]|uniref:Uncharacterized protein n=1 Tax=Schizophyllum amplum TaxID=97359 RepID=A0A550CD24_9AGAR|nr:hypothetical protein BD626DRAFT_498198 [Auriculariopsis ampla]